MADALIATWRSRQAAHRHRIWCRGPFALPQLPRHEPGRVLRLPVSAFGTELAPLKLGRFFPAEILRVTGPGRQFRVTEVSAASFTADFNPALSTGYVELGRESDPAVARALGDPGLLLPWAGMEAPLDEVETDFQEPDAFTREDTGSDAAFYATPRLVRHVDRACAARISSLYGELVAAGAEVLDLMSSRYSHLPLGHGRVFGLGMNAAEMAANPQLSACCVADLNARPALPFETRAFDAVVNTVSVEYLVDPIQVLGEVRRVLRPGGVLAVTFSNRFFPPKAARLWTRLHPMERLGLVLQWLAAAGFRDLHTLVERGLERPADDRYAEWLRESDPFFAAWGFR
jgi:SAM-dependent methyltransferase